MHCRYGDSNTLFKHDVALHSVDVAMQAVLQAAVTENMVANFRAPQLSRHALHCNYSTLTYRASCTWVYE